MGFLIPDEFSNTYSVNRRKIKRYISLIKNRLFELSLYNITILYRRSNKDYVCYINN